MNYTQIAEQFEKLHLFKTIEVKNAVIIELLINFKKIVDECNNNYILDDIKEVYHNRIWAILFHNWEQYKKNKQIVELNDDIFENIA